MPARFTAIPFPTKGQLPSQREEERAKSQSKCPLPGSHPVILAAFHLNSDYSAVPVRRKPIFENTPKDNHSSLQILGFRAFLKPANNISNFQSSLPNSIPALACANLRISKAANVDEPRMEAINNIHCE